MRNKDKGFSILFQIVQDFKQTFRLLRSQNRCRLIQNDDISTSHQCLDNLDTLRLTNGYLAYLLIQLHVHMILFNIFFNFFSCLVKVNCQSLFRFKSQNNILQNRQLIYQHKFLMDHADTVLNCNLRCDGSHRFPLDDNLALVNGIHAVQKLHHGGFTSSIFTNQ